MKKVIIDTDFLLHSLKFKIDIVKELQRICSFSIEVYILDQTLEELKGKPLEKLAHAVVEAKLKIIKTTTKAPVDDLLLEQKGSIIATDDKALKERLKKANFPVISIRQKKYYQLENVL